MLTVPPVVFKVMRDNTGSVARNLPSFCDLPFSPTYIIVVALSYNFFFKITDVEFIVFGVIYNLLLLIEIVFPPSSYIS